VVGDDPAPPPRRLTARGAATRERIIAAASDLMYVKGVAATTLGEILVASASSKSQFRQHFADKDDLVAAVIEHRAQVVLRDQTRHLARVDSIRGIEQWSSALLQRNDLLRGAWGCMLGSLAAELSDVDEGSRLRLADHFGEWEQLLAEAVARMRDSGILRDDVDPAAVATSIMAAVQGGYLLAQVSRDSTPMKLALDMALAHLRTFQTSPPG
jgi:AcrR family transcriptional regulator